MTYTLTEDQIDMLPEDVLLAVYPVTHESRGDADASFTAEWREAIEDRLWELPTHGKIYGTRIVLWTHTDEAGVADVAVRDLTDAADDVREYAREIAAGLDCRTTAN